MYNEVWARLLPLLGFSYFLAVRLFFCVSCVFWKESKCIKLLEANLDSRANTYVTSWFSVHGIVCMNNGADYAFFVCFVRPVRPRFLRLRKVKRQSRPCIYYANTISSFQPLLEGDLVFKLNPGPEKSYQISSRLADSGGGRQGTKRSSRNSGSIFCGKN